MRVIITILFLLGFFALYSQVEYVSTGTATAYDISVPGVFPLRKGMQVTFKAHTSCGSSPTVNISGNGPTQLLKNGGSALNSNDIITGQIVTIAYDGSKWQMLSPIANATNGTVTSVGITAPASLFTISGSPVTSTGTLTLGFQTLTSNLFFASPNGLGGPPSFRGIVSADLPLIPLTKGGTNASLSAVNGGVVYSDASAFGITAAGTSGQVLQSNGAAAPSWVTPSFLPSGTSGQTLRHNGTGWIANSFLYNDGTKIGIGLTSPASKLHITTGGGQYNTNALRLEGDYTSGGNYQQFDFSRNADGAPVAGFRSVFDVGGMWSLDFYGSNSGSVFNQHILRMQGDGKVGIGTSSPGSALDVVGNINLSGAISLSGSTGTNGFLLSSTGTGPSQWIDPNSILPSGATAWTKSGSVIFNTSLSDNIGIGTSSPGKLLGADRYLTLSGTDLGTSNLTASLELVGNTGTTNTMASKIDFLGLDFTSAVIPRARVEARSGNGATLAGQLLFYTNSNGSSANLIERMRIRESGEVGIGTSGVVGSLLSIGASNQFQVSSTGNLTRVNNVTYSWPAANASGFLSNNGSGTLTWSSAGILAGGTSNYIPKWTSANSLSSTSLLFDNGTTVGINTATPSASSKLHVVGSGNGSTLLVDDNSITNGSVLYLSSTATTGTASSNSRMITIDRSGANANASHVAYGIQSNITNTGTTSTNVAGFFSASGATNNYAIIVPSTGGRVGLGTIAPSHPLTISSNTGGVTLQSIRSFAASAFANSLAFQKGRGTESSPLAVNSGDGLGYLDFYGHNSVNGSMQFGASIFAEAAQNFTISNAAGSNLVFSTSPLNSNAPVERMTVYYNGAVGIGTTSVPATAKLRVEGDVEIPAANEYSYATAKTKYLNVPAVAFRGGISVQSTFSPGSQAYAYFNSGTAGLSEYVLSPIYLPDGAVITAVDAYVYDNDAVYNVGSVDLMVKSNTSLSGSVLQNISTGTTVQNTVIQTLGLSGLSLAVNNALNSYYLRVNLIENNSAIRLYGVRVTYSVDKAD